MICQQQKLVNTFFSKVIFTEDLIRGFAMKVNPEIKKKILLLSCLTILIISLPLAAFMSNGNSTKDTTRADFKIDEAEVLERTDKLSHIQFSENIGQIENEDILFYGMIPGGTIGFAESKIFLMMEGNEGVTTLTFVGAANIAPQAIEEIEHRTNYFLGERGTYENVKSFQSVVYHDLWTGIYLLYKATEEGAKYEFEVSPGVDPDNIQIRVDGNGLLNVDQDSVRIEIKEEYFVDDGLLVTQGNTRIASSFKQIDEFTFGFDLDQYDRTKKLVIDPLMYSTYVGGNSNDNSPQIGVDDDGNVYVVGYTDSTNFPTLNGYNDTLWGSLDIFVFKLDPTGMNLIYSTYIGGELDETMDSMVIDIDGNVYVTGTTGSQNFPVTQDALNSTHNGFLDIYVLKLNSTGNGLDYSTYYGGTDEDTADSIALDSNGNVYVLGATKSADFPTKNAYDDTWNLNYDFVAFKLNSTMTKVEYSTYIGGSGTDYADVIDVDNSGNMYILGSTNSVDFPTTPNAYNTSTNGGLDMVVTKLNSTGDGLEYSTYIGGSAWEGGDWIVTDSLGNAYVIGTTASTDFPTVNPYNDTHSGLNDVCVFKLNSTGNGLDYSTYIGGSQDDGGRVIRVDSQGCAYLAIDTDSANFPIVSAYDSSYNGDVDVGIAKLNSTGNGLDFSTFFGGSDEDSPMGMVLEPEGTLYVSGITSSSTDFPLLNPYDYTHNGARDVFVFKLVTDETNPTLSSPQDLTYTIKDTGNQIQWSASDSNPCRYRLTFDGMIGEWVDWSGGTITINVDGLESGVYTCTITVEDSFGNYNQDSVVVTVLADESTPDIDSPEDVQYELGETGAQIQWNVGDRSPDMYKIVQNRLFQEDIVLEYSTWVNGTITISVDNLTVGVYTFTLTVYDGDGNSARDVVLVYVVDTVDPEISSPADIEYEESISGESIDWIVSDHSPESYEITRNGISIIAGAWDGCNISIDVGSLFHGEYIFTLVVHDASGN